MMLVLMQHAVFRQLLHCSALRLGSRSAFMSTLNPRPSPLVVGRASRAGSFSRYCVGICGMSGMGPLPKSLGRVVIFCEYRLLTRSAVLSARWGLSRGTSPLFCLERLDSVEGRPELDILGAAMLAPAGMGALICRGALMVGGPFFLSLSRFLRSEMPFDLSDMLPASCGGAGDRGRGVRWVHVQTQAAALPPVSYARATGGRGGGEARASKRQSCLPQLRKSCSTPTFNAIPSRRSARYLLLSSGTHCTV
jgi:hypothetical protein